MLPETKVFDIALYSEVDETERPVILTEDLAGLVIEAGDKPLQERVNARRFRVVNGTVVDPKTGNGIHSEWGYKTELQTREGLAANSFYNYLLENPEGLVVSISPSGGPAEYLEARINVGYRNSGEEIEFYGIPSRLDKEYLLNSAVKLNGVNSSNIIFTSSEDLREISLPVKIPLGKSPWEYLTEVFLLDSDAWSYIAQGIPWKIKEAAEADAEQIAHEINYKLAFVSEEIEYIEIGAWAEMSMEKKGWKLLSTACPGQFNSELIMKKLGLDVPSQTFTEDSFGNIRKIKWEYHTGKCLNCKSEGVDVGPCNICKKCEKIL